MKLDPPPDVAALMAAYIAATGLALTLSYERARALQTLVDRGLTAEDVTAVLQRLKRFIARGDKGYTENSLDFRNSMLNADTFEERALKLRQENFRRQAAKPKPQIAVVRGDTAFLDEQPATEPQQMSKSLVRETLKRIAEGI